MLSILGRFGCVINFQSLINLPVKMFVSRNLHPYLSQAAMEYLPEFDVEIPEVDLLSLLFDTEFAWAKENTVIHAEAHNEGNCITKGETVALTKRLAYALRTHLGVGRISDSQATVVTCISSNQLLLPIVFYSVIGAGGIYSAASAAFTSLELTRQIQQSGSNLVIASDDTAQTAMYAAQQCGIPLERVLVLRSTSGSWGMTAPSAANGTDYLKETRELPWECIRDVETLGQRTIALLYSSGTTGVPKGVQLSHKNFVAEAIITQAAIRAYLDRTGRKLGVDYDYRVLAHLPAAHVSGLQGYFINGIMAGGTAFWLRKYVFSDFASAARRHRITFISSVPAVFLRIAKSTAITDEFKTLLHAQSGAAPMGQELQAAVQAKLGCPFSQAWGLTETTGAVTWLPWDQSDISGSISHLLPNTRLKIEGETGGRVPEGEVGEILVRGPNVTMGYHNNKEATREAFTKDGWFRTGDIGLRRDGKFYIVDRKKDLIKYKGLQVAPAEIEALLISRPDILDAAVVAIPDPELPGNEVPRAFIVRQPRAFQITATEVTAFARDKLAAHKQLRGGVEFIDEIPRNPSGKILRRNLVGTVAIPRQGKL